MKFIIQVNMNESEQRRMISRILKAHMIAFGVAEINMTPYESGIAEEKELAMFLDNGMVSVKLVEPEAWPESEARIDAIGQNGPTGEHYDEVAG